MLHRAAPYNEPMSTLELYEKALELHEAGKGFALATVIHTTGSTPQKAGASALFEAAGPVWGTLGGGCMEAESRRRALLSLDNGEPQLFDLKLDEVTGWDDGLICGGKVRILVQPNPAFINSICGKLNEASQKRERGALLTVLQHPELPLGETLWLSENQDNGSSLFNDTQAFYGVMHKTHAPFIYTQGMNEFYAERVILAKRLRGKAHFLALK